jgi:hypothetical protein
MTVAEPSCLPRTVGSEWVALSEAAAAIVRSIRAPQPPTRRRKPSEAPQR